MFRVSLQRTESFDYYNCNSILTRLIDSSVNRSVYVTRVNLNWQKWARVKFRIRYVIYEYCSVEIIGGKEKLYFVITFEDIIQKLGVD